jgi:rhamnosyltransferase
MTQTGKIVICMATYNGARFLRAQLDSFIHQQFTNWQLLVHDDGSTDQTLAILSEYADRDQRITVLPTQPHMGVIKGFLGMLAPAEADYYMFSDQDDVWEADKLSTMIEAAAAYPVDQPLLMHCDVSQIDANGDAMPEAHWNLFEASDFGSYLLNNNVIGCTTLFNRKARDLVQAKITEIDPDRLFMHDWLIALIASGLGSVVHLKQPLVAYRQHENNVVGASSRKHLVKRLYERLTLKKKLKIWLILQQAEQFTQLYGRDLSANQRRQADAVVDLLHHYRPVAQLRTLKKLGLTMHAHSRDMQLRLFIWLPLALRKRVF